MSRVARLFTGIASLLRPLRGAVDDLFPSIIESDVKEATDAGWRVDGPDAYCHRCGASVGPGEATARGCSHCVNHAITWDRIARLSAYKPPVEPWIIAMKFHKIWPWAAWFGRSLAQVIAPIPEPDRTLICPVPMPWLRRWRRGFNQAHLMAEALGRSLGVRCAALLRRKGWQAPQTTVLPSQRAENVRRCFEMQPVDLTDWHLWLVDDVKTTGSTLSVCTRLLKKAGAASVSLAVAAVADPKKQDFKKT